MNRRRQQRLFQSEALTAIFGTTVATMVTRIILVVVAVATLAIIGLGLLLPGSTAPQTTISTSTNITSQATTNSTVIGTTPGVITNTPSAPVGIQVGEAAPNFTLNAPDGKNLSLSDYRGKPVMLNFWYATCPGCLAEIPGMQKFYATQKAAGKDFVILGVNSVDDAQTALQFMQQYGLTYPIAMDESQRVLALYNVGSTPTSFFINRQGIIRLTMVGPVDDTQLRQDVTQIS